MMSVFSVSSIGLVQAADTPIVSTGGVAYNIGVSGNSKFTYSDNVTLGGDAGTTNGNPYQNSNDPNAKGSAPRAYVGDSTDRSRVVMRSLSDELRRVVQGETQNPKFIQAMMNHGYKGASDMSNVVSHSFGWDATSDIVPDWVYEGYANKYALDTTVQDWMRDVNPWALQRIAEILLEAAQRGYWDASPKMLENLQSLYISIEGVIEGR
ncbi:hypothetical protein HMPREF0870_01361 [Veillonella atypica KON]|uniref:CobN/magnesium chelatase domain-containing protein n=1 Tax=Veillonella atypica KON TaxID=1128111 RepID=A0ABP2SVY2_9FIRM|nr:hypothetical protein HMPREF0870_01361 [Veillonella atypica KON]